jgi:elongation factor Ts
LARDLAMHVAAESPEYLNPEAVPAEIRAKEEDIARSQVQGKPANIIDKIIEGKLKAYYDEVCFICQKYVKDNTMSVTELLKNESKRLGKQIEVKAFYRWKVGG